MTLLKIIIFVLSAAIAIGQFYSTKLEKPKLVHGLSIGIIVVAIFGIICEIKDARSRKQEESKAQEAYNQINTRICLAS